MCVLVFVLTLQVWEALVSHPLETAEGKREFVTNNIGEEMDAIFIVKAIGDIHENFPRNCSKTHYSLALDASTQKWWLCFSVSCFISSHYICCVNVFTPKLMPKTCIKACTWISLCPFNHMEEVWENKPNC